MDLDAGLDMMRSLKVSRKIQEPTGAQLSVFCRSRAGALLKSVADFNLPY